jgi:D-beta-D-heptose 7-phosphate kinase/D-beta-D-heptose 1-phosphate adenosyltransferase
MSRHLAAAAERFAGARVAVIGDVMLDSYLEGSARRLSREAPVPIVAVARRDDAPGGAANAAANVRSLGGQVRLLGLVGRDEAARRLRAALNRRRVSPEDLVATPARATLAKQRILAGGQLLVRFDEGTCETADAEVEQMILAGVEELHTWCDAMVVSDYGYGVLTDAVIDRIEKLQAASRRVLVADAKQSRRLARLRPTAVKPNFGEAELLIGLQAALHGAERAAAVVDHASELLELTGAENVLVTLDGDGSVLLRQGATPHRTYARPVANDHAAGAGDTVAATLALALAAGADIVTATELAAVSSAVAVGKAGTATCNAEELGAMLTGAKQAWSLDELRRRVELERGAGRRIVFTNGCFDILHPGHVTYLKRAKALGDVLVVAVNSDDSVRRLKGEGRPVNSLADRMEVLAALSSIDFLVAFEEDAPVEVIRALRPDIVTKGGDYTEESLPEAELVRRLGGTVRILPFVQDRSTSRIIERIGAGAGHAVLNSPRSP